MIREVLFTDGDIARPGDVDWKTALQIITVDLEHPGLGDSAAPVKRHFFRGRVKTQTGFEFEVARLYGAGAIVHADRIVASARHKRLD